MKQFKKQTAMLAIALIVAVVALIQPSEKAYAGNFCSVESSVQITSIILG